MEALRYSIAVALVSALSLVVGIGVYALGSFLLMRPHTAARRFGVSMRELFREIWIASYTQPLVPLYYLFGRRMGSTKGDVPVVLVHGYMQNRACFLGLAHGLTKRGVGPVYAINYPWYASITDNARRLDRFVREVCEETKAPRVDLVCHSMGGLVAMEMMRDEVRAKSLLVRRCVTIATPHAGIVWRGPLLGFGASNLRRGSKLLAAHAGYKIAVPCLSLYSSHDNLVHPKESSQLALRGGRDVEVEDVAHLAILFSPKVAEHTSAFLREPEHRNEPVLVRAADVAGATDVSDATGVSGNDDDGVADADGAPEEIDPAVVHGDASQRPI